ncbi:MAG: hypothetical protein HMLKMBBP_01691 [Planctomycetes bacterium]|nr:hypothetical protein [Planctomycetota bacterium]
MAARRRTLRLPLRLTLALLCLVSGACGSTSFSRVTEFPTGKQEDALIGGLFAGIQDTATTSIDLPVPATTAWVAVRLVADDFAKIGGRTVTGIDENSMRIKNGNISQNAAIGGGVGSWMDQFTTEVTATSPSTSRVSVTRKLVRLTQPTGVVGGHAVAGRKEWQAVRSNGEIERWILTRVQDALSASGGGT